MSGGSYEYVEYKLEEIEDKFYYALEQLGRMEKALRDERNHAAADEIYHYILFLETAKRRLEVQRKRITDLVHTVEWTHSGDYGDGAIDQAVEKLLEGVK